VARGASSKIVLRFTGHPLSEVHVAQPLTRKSFIYWHNHFFLAAV